MNEMLKTILFLIVAAAIAFATVIMNAAFKPQIADYAKLVGTEFYPEFTDPNAATSLKVTQYDATKDELRQFEVVNNNGKWTIPTHHSYPADGAERLSKTAASVIGIKREGLAGRREAEYEKFGVVDPLNAPESQTKGRGDRITINKKDGTLCDYIIGKQVEGKEGYRYVRKEGETRIYIAQINPDLSTKFVDWIEPNLLKIDRNQLNSLLIYRYQVDEVNRTFNEQDRLNLTREKADAEWLLDGLNPEKEELVQTEVNSIINQLDQLKIVGVRPKPEGLGASLKNNKEMKISPLSRADLMSKGFYLKVNGDGSETMVSNEGELWAGTSQGVNYTIRFGEVFEGDAEDIEIGKTQDAKPTDKPDADKKQVANELKKSRYVFVTAEFDVSLLGNPPAKPEKPAILDEPAPAATPTPTKEEPKTDSSKDKTPEINKTEKQESPPGADKPQSMNSKSLDGQVTLPVSFLQDEKPVEQPAETKPTAANAGETKPAGTTVEEAKPAEQKAPETQPATTTPVEDPAVTRKKAEDSYNAAMEQYKRDLEAFNKKKDDGKKLAKQLTVRFADWYYVISADSFESFSKSREKLVKPKTAEKPAAENGSPAVDKPTTDNPAGSSSDTTPTSPPDPGSPTKEMKPEKTTTDAPSQPESTTKSETPAKQELPEINPAPKTEN